MENNKHEWEFEVKHLEQTTAVVRKQLEAARQSSNESREEILSLKKEMREDTVHSIKNLWSLDNFYELVELNQYANPISDKITEYEMEANRIFVLEKILESPYFARIDFKFEGESDCEKVYIGMSSVMDDETYDMYVYDWRSPIASVFYRFGTGKAFYDAPQGRVSGEVALKRQYEIKKGRLEYFFDADVQILDDFLRKLLSQNASSKMKSIVETIQKDQDIIIRDMENDLMMVQGVAGSGKTSVALHRVAYLMYQGLADRLAHNNIIIISPNTLFEQYISNVLPELGEKNVSTAIFEDIISRVLQKKRIQTRNQLLEALLSSEGRNEAVIRSSMELKSSSRFVELLRRFIKDLPRKWMEFSDIYYDSKYIAGRQQLKSKLLSRGRGTHLGQRLKQLEDDILDTLHQLRITRMNKLKALTGDPIAARRLSIRESAALLRQIRKFTDLDSLMLYKMLFSSKSYFYSLAKGLELPDCIDEIIDYTRQNLKGDILSYDDTLALAFLHLNIHDYTDTDYQAIKQVVIDEAQDYSPMHFEVLNLLFPKARYTVLGDINQTIGKLEDISLYEQIGRILNKEKSALVTLDKSFRCTSDILEYSAKFLDTGFAIKSFNRKGDPPAVHTAKDISALDDMMVKEIQASMDRNYQSIGLICKTEKDAASLYERLKGRLGIQLVTSNVKADLKGVSIMPVYLAKGLEFDSVLICDADKEHYSTAQDRKLLYVACTRALHRLNLFYTGDISPLL